MPIPGSKGAVDANVYIAGAPIICYRVVTRGTDQNSVVPAGANALPIGIAAQNQQRAGATVPIVDRAGEEVLAEAGAAFALDALLTSDANGRLITATTGQNVVAIARQAATLLGDLVNVEIAQRGYLAP